MACSLFSAKPLSEQMLAYSWFNPLGTNFNEIWIKIQQFSYKKMSLEMPSAKWWSCCLTLGCVKVFSLIDLEETSEPFLHQHREPNRHGNPSLVVLRWDLSAVSVWWTLNTLRPRQNRRHFADDILNYIFLNENVWIPIKISLKFFPQGPINNIPVLVQIMAWRQPGDKPLSGPMMVRFPTHICVTRPQWVKELMNCHQPL